MVIDDTAAGIAAAKRAEMKAIGVTNTLPRGKLTSADRVLQSLEELDPRIIARLFISPRGVGYHGMYYVNIGMDIIRSLRGGPNASLPYEFTL